MQQACTHTHLPVTIRQGRDPTWNLCRDQAMQSSKVLQRSVSSTSTTFSSCSRAALSLDCGTAEGPVSSAKWTISPLCGDYTSMMKSLAKVKHCTGKRRYLSSIEGANGSLRQYDP